MNVCSLWLRAFHCRTEVYLRLNVGRVWSDQPNRFIICIRVDSFRIRCHALFTFQLNHPL